MSNNIAGKIVVITSASSGLGQATARLLSAQARMLCRVRGAPIAASQLHTEQPRLEIASYPSRKSNGTMMSEAAESIHHQRVTALRARPSNNIQAK